MGQIPVLSDPPWHRAKSFCFLPLESDPARAGTKLSLWVYVHPRRMRESVEVARRCERIETISILVQISELWEV